MSNEHREQKVALFKKLHKRLCFTCMKRTRRKVRSGQSNMFKVARLGTC